MKSITPFSLTCSLVTAHISSASGTIVTGKLGDAVALTNNPIGPRYCATFPNTLESPLQGNMCGFSSTGSGVWVSTNFYDLPLEDGPLLYHIHDQPVPSDGNCTDTLAHLDPYIRGETPSCDATLPQTCQVGDLSGKHGTIDSDPYIASYMDDYISTLPGIGAFFGNRSVVIHYANKTRITCANFSLIDNNVTTVSEEGGESSTTGIIPSQISTLSTSTSSIQSSATPSLASSAGVSSRKLGNTLAFALLAFVARL
ncbi:MAG: hypothetical protein M1834_006516 [Cirrosporium novae-zelandiae]|nr:MAG: hypothetical protein M1834_006516 [Cirrosporium novae-zelandiae]